MRLQVRSLASLSGLRIQRCCELWCGSRVRLGSRVAVVLAKAGGYSSDWTPSLGTSICLRRRPQKTKDKIIIVIIIKKRRSGVMKSLAEFDDVIKDNSVRKIIVLKCNGKQK